MIDKETDARFIGLSPVKWCNKSGQRSAAVPDVIFFSKCCC